MANTAFSAITVNDLVSYLRLTETTASDLSLLGDILEAAKSYILTYTGRDVNSADNYPEFTIAVYAISADMYDKRTYIVENDTTNKIIDSILGSRSINLL